MVRTARPPPGGLNLGKRGPPGLKELTIELGDSDIYVNLSRRIEVDPGHTLYEAILTDAQGSRAIYIDREDILECLSDVFLRNPTDPSPPRDRRPTGPGRE